MVVQPQPVVGDDRDNLIGAEAPVGERQQQAGGSPLRVVGPVRRVATAEVHGGYDAVVGRR